MSRAGSRERKFRRNGMGRLSKEKIAIARTSVYQQLAILELDPQKWDKENEVEHHSEQGFSYVLIIPVPGRVRPLTWNMSAMTSEELEVTRRFFDHLFDLAEPVVKARDKEAQDAFAKGDDSFSRIYRDVPQFIVRQGQERQDSQGLQYGLEGPTGGDSSADDLDGGLRGYRDELADGESERSLGEDDGEETY